MKLSVIATCIGQIYLEMCEGDYDKAAEKISKAMITRLELNEDTLTITTGRPGMLIGLHGVTYEKLKNGLKNSLGLKIKIVEDAVIPWLFPYKEYEPLHKRIRS